MPPKRKKARLCADISIESLPTEIMWMIFDRLHIRDVKSASLTCHRWNDIILSTRLYLKIDIWSHDHRMVKKFKEVFSKSQRRYRSISWCTGDDQAMQAIWDTIHPKITNKIQSLEIIKTRKPITSLFALISDEIPAMTKLRSLALIDGTKYSFDQDIIPTLWSNSVSHLKVKSCFMFRVDMPELQVFEGDLSALNTPEQLLALPKLKHLTVRRDNFMENPISKIETFNAICESCTTLTELEFDRMIYSDVVNIANMTKLFSLKRMRVAATYFDPRNQYTHSVFDWSKLTQLEQLQLGDGVRCALKLPKSIKQLDVCIDSDNEESTIKTIIGCAAHLIELHISITDCLGSHEDYEEPIGLLNVLSHFKKLEVLTFNGGLFLQSSFLRMDTPLDNLQKLRFDGVELETPNHDGEPWEISNCYLEFLGLDQKFPKLREPEFKDCYYMCENWSEENDSSVYDSYSDSYSSDHDEY